MHLHLPHLNYSGPPIDDAPILDRLPPALAAALRERNGSIGWQGVVHLRGACIEPQWHSLRNAAEGSDSFPSLYPALEPTDLAFAEEAFGDQFLLRQGAVIRLLAETGETEPCGESIASWFSALLADPETILGYEPAQALEAVGGKLEPGQLVSAYPPFCIASETVRREFKPVAALSRRGWLAGLAARMRELPDGAEIDIKQP